jgi:hypothetical protein
MKSIKLCLIIAALCCIVPAMAQKSFGVARYSHMCSYYGEAIAGDITAYEAGTSAQNVVKDIMAVIGLKANFELRAANVPNAAAVLLKGKRFILYNPEYMNKINARTGSNWAAISIFAHEIGHHLNGHTLDNVGSRPQTELEADEFSGFVLHKMGASLIDAQAVMSLIASLKGSHSHPARADRLAYIATGWANAGNDNLPASTAVASVTQKPKAIVTEAPAARQNAVAHTTVAKRPVVKSKAAQTRPVVVATETRNQKLQQTLQSKNVLSDAYFNDDPNGKYYVTAKGNLVQVYNDKVYLVASLYKSDRQGYSLMFTNNNANKVYVADGGALVSSTGNKIGYMKSR